MFMMSLLCFGVQISELYFIGTIFSPISPVETVPACPVQMRAHHHLAVYTDSNYDIDKRLQ